MTVAPYDTFAPAYARWWGPAYAGRVLPALERLLLAGLQPGSRVLDLCCGSGDLPGYLGGAGYRMVCVDESPAMIAFARRRAPLAEHIVADARSFRITEPVDAAYSTFDSLNHVVGEGELALSLERVRTALRPGGVLLIDLNSEAAYLDHWDDTFGHADDDLACVVRVDYDEALRRGLFDAAVFERRPDGLWVREDVSLHQRPYEVAEVAGALEACGFEAVQAYAADTDLGMDGAAGRVLYRARVPTGAT